MVIGILSAISRKQGTVTIHKSQGSEFPAVVMPLAMQHYMLLQRNLIYTGITGAKRLQVLVGQKKALGIAVRNDQSRKRYSGLLSSLGLSLIAFSRRKCVNRRQPAGADGEC